MRERSFLGGLRRGYLWGHIILGPLALVSALVVPGFSESERLMLAIYAIGTFLLAWFALGLHKRRPWCCCFTEAECSECELGSHGECLFRPVGRFSINDDRE